MNEEIILIQSVIILALLIVVVLTSDGTVDYENGVKCGVSYMLRENQEGADFIVKNYPVSDKCAYIVEERIKYKGVSR